MRPMGGLAVRSHEMNAVEDERVAGEDVEQQDALEDLGQIERNLHRDLRLLAADERERQEQARDQYPDRIQPAEERKDERGEAIARRTVVMQVTPRPGTLDDAGKPRQRPGYDEG